MSTLLCAYCMPNSPSAITYADYHSYFLVAASIAELASAIPSSAGVYQWATITPGKRWGRPIGFFAGYWNWLGWTFGLASQTSIVAQTIVQMYVDFHLYYSVRNQCANKRGV